jgi:hypothetical protein
MILDKDKKMKLFVALGISIILSACESSPSIYRGMTTQEFLDANERAYSVNKVPAVGERTGTWYGVTRRREQPTEYYGFIDDRLTQIQSSDERKRDQALVVTLSDLFQAFADDTPEAEDYYSDKYIRVTGIVSNVERINDMLSGTSDYFVEIRDAGVEGVAGIGQRLKNSLNVSKELVILMEVNSSHNLSQGELYTFSCEEPNKTTMLLVFTFIHEMYAELGFGGNRWYAEKIALGGLNRALFCTDGRVI